ncbi:MAG TPA: ATP-grasp domain-containing protein, partial [Pirellulales bacterium]|nr:ATP-grasp domain-containing protein [Pirellulales bacterium]
MSVFAGDLFGDLDLQACCRSVRVSDYPHGLLEVLSAAPAGTWMYTGGLENHPDLVERMEPLGRLWGNTAACLRQVRNPLAVFEALSRHGLSAPRVAERCDNLPTDGTWLVKDRRSAGGSGVAVWRGNGPLAADVYFQEHIAGQPCGAVYLAAGGEAVFLGVTQQLLGAGPVADGRTAAAKDFRYAGSIGPLALEPEVLAGFHSLGRTLAAEFPLSGLFGVDVVVAGQTIWPVEINPRYTASVEILERGGHQSLLAWHAAACADRSLPASAIAAAAAAGATPAIVWGKRILFSRHDLEVGERTVAHLLTATCTTL